MEFRAYNPKEKEEKVIYFTLTTDETGVFLDAVDENGHCYERGGILTIDNDGIIYLHKYVHPDLGLKLNPEGAVKCTT